MPTRFTRVGPLPCQFFLDAQYAESLISRRDPFPLLPVDLSDATSQPFVCFQGEFRHRRTSKVPNPPIYVCLELSSKGVEALPPTPRSQFLELTQAFVTELLVRPISHDRLPVSLSLNPESKTKGLTGVSGFLCLGRLFQGQPNEAALCSAPRMGDLYRVKVPKAGCGHQASSRRQGCPS